MTIGPDRVIPDDAPPQEPTTLAQRAFPGRLGISVEEFAASVGLGRTAAYLAVRRGEVPTKRIGGRIVIPFSALDGWFSR